MTQRIALVTDSTCDIPAEWRTQYDIAVVPLTIVWGNQQYLDGVELSAEAFYARLLEDPDHPKTSQPTPQSFLDSYRQAAEKGAQEVMVFTISSAMSGTIQAARLAAQESPIPVHILDSKNNSMGLGWQVIAAARAQESGADAQGMQAAAEAVRRTVAYYISLDTMEYLTKGGRIGGAVRFLDSVLKIKPMIYVNHDTGVVGASMPARSRSAAIEGLYKEFFKHGDPGKPLHITVLHNAALPEAQQLADRVQAEYHPCEMFISIVSPILGVHTGPRAIALCGYWEE
jgi:DegV family protein with EDD domain